MDAQKAALITGGGIGRAVAERLARAGFRVAITGRNGARLREAVEAIGRGATAHVADVSDRQAVGTAVAEIVAAHGQIDVLVNNAGVMPIMTLDVPAEEGERIWDEAMAINLKGAYLVTQAVYPHLTAPGGRIINMSSITGQTGGAVPGFFTYATTKAGIIGFTQGLARELGPKGITVNAISPGFIAETGITSTFTPERIAGIRATLPLGRPGHVDDIAGAVHWLVSPDAAYVTGQLIPVNGGMRFALG